MAEVIGEIRASGDQSAERYIAEYNFYVNNALLFSGMTSSTVYPDENEHVVGDIMTLTDSTGEVAGYMYFIENWDEDIADSGITIINKGISLYPDRLDMRYGKIHLLRKLHWWNAYADAIHATLDYAEKHRKTMIFANGDTPIDTILIEGILNYEGSLFEAIQDSPDSLTFQLGSLSPIPNRHLKDVKELLQLMGPVVVEDNFIGTRWTKLLINASFSGLSTALGATFGETIKPKDSRKVTLALIKECIDVAHMGNIRFEPVQGKDVVTLLDFKNPIKKSQLDAICLVR